MVEHFNLQELAGADEVARDLNVCLRRSWIPARVVVLCPARIYVKRHMQDTARNAAFANSVSYRSSLTRVTMHSPSAVPRCDGRG
jgi:hypothetical protein